MSEIKIGKVGGHLVGMIPYDAELEYLESTGTQYIDTGVTPYAANDYFSIKFSISDGVSGEMAVLSGGQWTINGNLICFLRPTYLCYYDNQQRLWEDTSAYELRVFEVTRNNSEVVSVVDGVEQYRLSGTVFNVNASAKYTIFRVAMSNSRYFKGKVYGCNIVTDQAEVDLIPVRVGDVGYMYDRAHPFGGPLGNGLYPNKGTGSFVLGPDVVRTKKYRGRNAFTIRITDDYRDFHFTEGTLKYNSTYTQSAIFLATGHTKFSVQWGDGSPVEWYDANTKEGMHHEYARNGDYTVVISDDISSFCLKDNTHLISVDNIAPNNTLAPFYWYKVDGSFQRLFEGCTYLEKADLTGSEVLTNTSGLFKDCKSIREIYFTDSFQIGPSLFMRANVSGRVDVPKTTSVGNYAFYSAQVGILVLGESLTSIGYQSFYGFKGYMVMKSLIPPTAQQTSFMSFSGTIYVPDDSVDSYKSAEYWSAIADKIKPMSEYAG